MLQTSAEKTNLGPASYFILRHDILRYTSDTWCTRMYYVRDIGSHMVRNRIRKCEKDNLQGMSSPAGPCTQV